MEDIRDLYNVTRVKEIHMKKFNTKGLEYSVTFKDNLDIYNHAAVLDTLLRVFDSLFGTLTEGAGPKNLVRVVVMSPEFDYPIQLPFIAKDKLTAERFLARIEQVIQSNEQFSLDSSLQINITHVVMPLGGKMPKKRYVNFDRFLRDRKCILQIVNKDDLCCARAIVTAKARIDGHERWDSIRRGYSLQQTLAEDLHRQAQVPLNKCSVEEIELFQGVLPGYQIVVASKEHFNAIIFKGQPADKQIYPYYHHGHYDVITKMPAFLNRSYFCLSCLKGYNTKIEHRCENSCKLCFHTNCVEEDWVYCNDCNRHFKSKSCFENHLQQNGAGTSVCKTHYRCKDCSQFVSRRQHKGKEHVCSYEIAFLKMKQEASDWPQWCQTDDQKHEYIQRYFDREGIRLEWDNIQKNPGLRALAKLMLNCFWGKFGQRPNMTKTSRITDPVEYFEMMTSDEIEVSSANFVSEEMVKVQWRNTEDFIEPSGRTNVIIAAYTTAQARLKLYELLETLDRRVLYYDTDSVIFVIREGDCEPETGDYLGELTNAIDADNHITAFVSGGPENYAYKMAKPDRSGNTTFCKVRDITLNYRNQFIVNFNTMFQMVHGVGPTEVQVVDPHKITRNKKAMNIESKEEKKNYQVVYTKRVRVDGHDTVPYGF